MHKSQNNSTVVLFTLEKMRFNWKIYPHPCVIAHQNGIFTNSPQVIATQKLKKLTIKHFQGIKLLLTLKAVHKDGDVKARVHFNAPGASLGVKIVAGVSRAKDYSGGLSPDLIRRALCWREELQGRLLHGLAPFSRASLCLCM